MLGLHQAAIIFKRISLWASRMASGVFSPPLYLAAAVTGAALDRFAEAGALYAGDPAAPLVLPGLINIAVYDAGGRNTATLHPDSAMPLPPPMRK